MTAEEVGSVFGQLQDCSEVECEADAGRLLSRLANTTSFGARGGLRVCAPGSEPIVPGCCCGLENWTDWRRFIERGDSLFLGHDPTPSVEECGDQVCVWADVTKVSKITFSRSGFVGALRAVHEDLRGFLLAARGWAEAQGMDDPQTLIDKVDRCLAINHDRPLYWELG
jgi:hypothetical protein